ncbi:hypothetical protein OS189_12320 [Sulfitobacter sp. F26169L]|uniref:hypothetical protein n=1 Tax=Sulfitobacter sp. F26169L TaxID=2996015 RepID=UPI002260B181|nr:hypothetical protein [Sulfitobacter sp. F26169L]MCX7567129.1 hypothetical protein [Sulfitobacter sp. F26169L]
MRKTANSRNIPGHAERAAAGLAEEEGLLRRYLVHYLVFGESQLPQIAKDELDFRRMAILQRCRPDVFQAVYPDFRKLLDDSPAQFTVQ